MSKRTSSKTRPRVSKAVAERAKAAEAKARREAASARKQAEHEAAKQARAEARQVQREAAKAAKAAEKQTAEYQERQRAQEAARQAERDVTRKAREEERAATKEAKAAEKARLAAEKRKAIESARANAYDPDRGWVADIKDPKQRALARAIPAICDIFGLAPWDMVGRGPADDPAGMVINSVQKTCLGAVVYLGRDLGVRWNALHGRTSTTGQSGETEIRDLVDAHRMTMQSFRRQFAALTGLPVRDEDGVTGEPIGEIGAFVRARFAPIRAAAFAEVGQAYAGGDEAEAAE